METKEYPRCRQCGEYYVGPNGGICARCVQENAKVICSLCGINITDGKCACPGKR